MAGRRGDGAAVARADAIDLLSRVPLFSGCTRKELQAIARTAKQVAHPAGAVLAREGERGIGFFLILDGTARVTVGGRARQRLGPGDFFGEIALLDEGPRTATVTAETPVILLGVTAWVFKGLVEQNPSIALKLLQTMAERVRNASRNVTH